MPNHFENIVQPNDDNVRGSNNTVTGYFHTDKDPFEQSTKWGFKYHFVPIPKRPMYDDVFAPHPYDSNKSPEGNIRQTLKQWIGNLAAFHMAPSDADVYVRIRPDIYFNGPLTFQKPEPKTIYIPSGMDYRGVNDQFAYGDWETMRDYFLVLENCHHLWHKGVMFNSEAMQKANLKDRGIKVVRFDSPQHDLAR